MIIGLTGSNCSGKDTVAEYLVKNKGYAHISLSDVLREEMRLSKINITRDNLIKIGTELRRKQGNAVLARRIIKYFENGKNYVVTSIRHCDEVKELRKQREFFLIFIDAPIELRFERILKRNRQGDPKTINELIKFEKRESKTKGPGQQLEKCRQMADAKIINDKKDYKELYSKIDKLLVELKT